MFTLTIKAKDGSERIESFATREEMASMRSTYIRCGITAIPSEYVDVVAPSGSVKVSYGKGR